MKCRVLFLLLAGVAFDFVYGGLSAYRYSIENAKDIPTEEENDNKFWKDDAIGSLGEKLNQQLRTNKAKNLILFLGDGMSIPTITAARIYKGQLDQRAGENSRLSFEHFPVTGLSKTYCVDKQVADSACTSTAYLGGVKANYGTLGVTAAVPLGNCNFSTDPKNHVQSILMWAQAAGKGTGLVTTAAITDASPAGGYSHSANREWQSDLDLHHFHVDPKMCADIAQQLVRQKPGSDVQVILGGGQNKFLPSKGSPDLQVFAGERLDGADLVEEWKQDKITKNKTARFVYDRKGLLAKNITNSDYIFGLFQPLHMLYHLEDGAEKQPTLEEMTKVAIERLQKEPNGYFIFIEGALIDKAHHRNWAHRALDETVEFSKAIEMAVKLTSEDDTLIVVTADHAHTMSMSGYPIRGNNILGRTTTDNETYSTLAYINGPSATFHKDNDPYRYSEDDIYNDTYLFPSMVNLIDETHGGDDVAIYARGPWSHLFTGSIEQHLIPHMMAYAAQIGPAGGIRNQRVTQQGNSASSVTSSNNLFLLIISFAFISKLLS